MQQLCAPRPVSCRIEGGAAGTASLYSESALLTGISAVNPPQVRALEGQVHAAAAAVQELGRKTQPLEAERTQRMQCAPCSAPPRVNRGRAARVAANEALLKVRWVAVCRV